MRRIVFATVCLVMVIGGLAAATLRAQNGEWRSYAGDPGSRKYAPLDQINKDNVKTLRIAWRRPAVDPPLAALDPKLQVPNNFRVTPLMIGRVLYSPNGVGLVEALTTGRVKPGSLLLMPGFGGGLTNGAVLVRWGARVTPLSTSSITFPANTRSA